MVSLCDIKSFFLPHPLATQIRAQKQNAHFEIYYSCKTKPIINNLSAVSKRRSYCNSEQDISARPTLLFADYGLVGVSIWYHLLGSF